MNHTGVDKLVYGVRDRDAASRFWTDFGLEPAGDGGDRAAWRAANGATIELRSADDPDLPPPVGADVDATLREVTFGVQDAADIDALEDALSPDHEVRRDAEGGIRTTDPLGFGLAFRVTRNRPVAAPEQDVNVPGRATRVNRRAPRIDRARPLEVSHVVYVTDELEAHKEFYVDRLGFRVTDMYPGRGYFTRCSAAHHHHNLFLLNPGGGKRGFHHVAFEVGTIHDLFGGGNNMTRQGWKTMLGPGRHPISSCYFWYFHNPSGGAAEYDFDSDVVDDDWEAATWESKPENFAEWCLAEGMGEALLYDGIQRG